MKEVTTRYVGLDVHKATISIAVADDGVAPVLFGTIANDATAVRKAVSQLKRGGKLVAAYEAGPTGYGLHRPARRSTTGVDLTCPSISVSRPPDQSSRQRVRAGRGDDALGHPALDVVEAIEPGAVELADIAQRASIELHVGEVLEQDVIRLVVRALELLPGQGPAMHARELLDVVPDHDTEVLQAHPVDALVDRRDELDERDEGAVADDERLRQQDLRHGPAVPDVLHVGGRVRSEEHTSELQSQSNLVCRLLLEKTKPSLPAIA